MDVTDMFSCMSLYLIWINMVSTGLHLKSLCVPHSSHVHAGLLKLWDDGNKTWKNMSPFFYVWLFPACRHWWKRIADCCSHLLVSLFCMLNSLTPFSSLGIFGWEECSCLPGRSGCALLTGKTQRSQSVIFSTNYHIHAYGLFKGECQLGFDCSPVCALFTGCGGADAVFTQSRPLAL